jgi:hypothetical protein
MNKQISKFAEVFGRLATVYTGTNTGPEEFQKLLSSKKFVTGLATSNVYGPAIYAVYDKEKYQTFYGTYGKYIYKLAIDTTGFFSFNLETIRVLYPSIVKNIQMIEISKEEFEKYVGIDDEDGNLIGSTLGLDSSRKVFFEDGRPVPSSKKNEYNEGIKKTKEEIYLRKYDPSKKYFIFPSYKDVLIEEARLLGLNNFEENFGNSIPEYEPEYTASIAENAWRVLYPTVRGLLFNGSQDGSVAVIYDYDNSRVVSYTTVDKESQEISESSKFDSKENSGWLPSSGNEYMSESGGYSQKGGEGSVRQRARRNIDIMINEGLINNFGLYKNEAFNIEREYALDAITNKINSGNISDINEDFVSFLVNERGGRGSKNIEKLKPIFAKIVNSNINSARYILGNDSEGILTQEYLEWKKDNKDFFNTSYFTQNLIELDYLVLKNNPNALKDNIIEALQSPQNIRVFLSNLSLLNKLFDVLTPDLFSEIFRKYAEVAAKESPDLFLNKESVIPNASSDVTSSIFGKNFSKKESLITLYPDLINTAISNLKSIDGLSKLEFIKNISPNFISSESIDKIKNLIDPIVRGKYFNCSNPSTLSFFSSENGDIKKILDEIKNYVDKVCSEKAVEIVQEQSKVPPISSNRVPPPPPTQTFLPPLPLDVSKMFFYSGDANQNSVAQYSLDQIAGFLLQNTFGFHKIYSDDVWIDAKSNSEILAKYEEMKKERDSKLPPLPPPPSLPPLPPPPPPSESVTEQNEPTESLDKIEASFEFRKIKIARLLSALESIGINTLELSRFI